MRFIFILFALLLGACTKISGNIDSFSNEALINDKGVVFIKSNPPSLETSLEFSSYKKKLEEKLLEIGYQITAEEETADHIAYFHYDIDEGLVKDGSEVGQTRFSIGGIFGSSGSSGIGARFTIPIWGTGGNRPPPSQLYTRIVQVDIITADSKESDSPVKIYEGRISSKGNCGSLNEVMDELLFLLFDNFPDGSGKFSTDLKAEC